MFKGKTSNKVIHNKFRRYNYFNINLLRVLYRTIPSLAYILDIRSYDTHLLYYKIYNYYKYTNLKCTIEITYVYNQKEICMT